MNPKSSSSDLAGPLLRGKVTVNIAASEPWRPPHRRLDGCSHGTRQCQCWGSARWTPRAGRWPSTPAFASPAPSPACYRLGPVSASCPSAKRRVLNDVSILPPSFQPRHYSPAALSSSAPNLAAFPCLGRALGEGVLDFLKLTVPQF